MHKFSFFVLIFSFLCFIYSFVNFEGSSYSLIYLLPLALFILSSVFINIYNDYRDSWVFKIFIVQALIRYPLMSLIYCLSVDDASRYHLYSNASIVVMLVELISCFGVLAFFSKRQRNAFNNKSKKININKNYFIIITMLLVMFVCIFLSGALNEINLVFSLQDYVDKHVNDELQSKTTIGSILFTSFKSLLALSIVGYIYSINISKNVKSLLYFSTIVFASSFIVGLSRFSLVQFTLPLLILITYLISDKESKKLVNISLLVIFFAILISSLGKYSRYGNEATLEVIFNKYMINAYFAGPDNIANGLSLFESKYNLNYMYYLLNDTFQNIPLLSKMTLDEFKLNLDYNEHLYGHRYFADQIVPLSTSGLFHFGYIGVTFYSCLFLSIALFFERKSYYSFDLFYKYIYISLSISFTYIFMKNMSSFYSSLTAVFLFLFLPLFLVNLLKSVKVKI